MIKNKLSKVILENNQHSNKILMKHIINQEIIILKKPQCFIQQRTSNITVWMRMFKSKYLHWQKNLIKNNMKHHSKWPKRIVSNNQYPQAQEAPLIINYNKGSLIITQCLRVWRIIHNIITIGVQLMSKLGIPWNILKKPNLLQNHMGI